MTLFNRLPVTSYLRSIIRLLSYSNQTPLSLLLFHVTEISIVKWKTYVMMRDFFDSELSSKYPTRFGNNILQILLYFDDFEVANPLGSKRGIHKMLAVYFTLLNLPIKYRSKLESIHLTLLTKSSTVTRCGLDTVLAPHLIDDLMV